jgi:hypothetical protein
MTRIWRSIFVLAAAVALWSMLWSQQPEQESATIEKRLEATEQRLASIEKALEASAGAPARLPDAALESRLNRLETRLERLEAQSVRDPVGAPSAGYDRMLESRVRSLEQQVARLRR